MPLGHLYKFKESLEHPDRNELATSGHLLVNKRDGNMYFWDDSRSKNFPKAGEWVDWDSSTIPSDFEQVQYTEYAEHLPTAPVPGGIQSQVTSSKEVRTQAQSQVHLKRPENIKK
eukprot:m.255544 g.255544  ORF g.255544 m.255544 type:complete len:115 (+) comp19879_c0_seq1:357-701(+)